MPTIFTGTDNHARGQALTKSIPPGAVAAIRVDTAISPGENIPTSKLTADDTIPLVWKPVGSTLIGYNLSIADLDDGTQLVMALEYGDGTNIQTGLTVGRSAGKITDADADVNKIGIPVTLTVAQEFIQLLVTTTAQTVHAAAARITGVFLFMGQ